MNYKMMGRFVARTLAAVTILMIPALIISLFSQEWIAARSFVMTLAVSGAVLGILFALSRGAPKAFGAKEGLACAALSWIVICLVGCLPFWFSREIPRFIDAFFEIVSGFTTTGASVVAAPEELSNGILYWRSFSHWIGGMGVLVFLLAITANGKQGEGFTIHLLRAESPGPNVGKMLPKMRDTAAMTYIIYVVLTALNIIFLMLDGSLTLFQAACTAFGTAGTGGFAVFNDSLASCTPYVHNVTTVFMGLFGINFACYYLLLIKQVKSVWRDEELRLYLGVIFAAIALIVWNTLSNGNFGSFSEALRHAAFQVVSIITTTGYTTCDYAGTGAVGAIPWPSFAQSILLILMIIGACAGSTGGGLKCSRLLLIVKALKRNANKLMHPNRVQVIRTNGQTVDEQVVDNANAYLAAYVILLFASFVVVSLDNYSIGTNFSAVLSCFNNIGPGMEQVGPMCNFGGYSDLSKLVLSFDMLAGRLELFPLLTLFAAGTWKRR